MNKIKSNYENTLLLHHDLIGGKWKLCILWHIQQGDNRFSMLEKAIHDITPKVLSFQLNELVDSGILIKEVVDDRPPKVIIYSINEEYSILTDIMASIHIFSHAYAKNNSITLEQETD
ncbi:MAG: helix-turn-helix domain-containing protein [Clostridiales bacterium]|nr:helix-turn-helix domain-containing protein [Clostridiales bacterium]